VSPTLSILPRSTTSHSQQSSIYSRAYIEGSDPFAHIEGSLSYHDKTGLECDAVIHLRNGEFGLVEIKLVGETLIEEGVKSLEKISSLAADRLKRTPRFKMVLCAVGDYAYRRKDGIVIAPIASLRD